MTGSVRPTVAPRRRENSTVELRTILQVPCHSKFRRCVASLAKRARKEWRHEARKGQLGLNTIFLIILIVIAFKARDGFEGPTKLKTELLTSSEKVAIDVGKRSSCAKVACRIGTLGLERNGGRLLRAHQDVTIEKCRIGNLCKTNVRISNRLQTGKLVVGGLQIRSAEGCSFSQHGSVFHHRTMQMQRSLTTLMVVYETNEISRMVGCRRIVVLTVFQQVESEIHLVVLT